MPQNLAKDQLKFIGIIIVVVGVIVGIALLRSNLDLRQRASTATGPGRVVFNITSGGTGTTITPNASATISVGINGTSQSQIDGFQVFADITGTVPANLTLEAATISGANVISQSLSDISGGKRLSLVIISSNPQQPFNLNGATLTLGNLKFTGASTGTMTITVDQNLSKILQTTTGDDLLGISNVATFKFGTTATATPVVTAAPTPTPFVTLAPTPTPTPRPTVTPIPTATVRPSPTPIVTALPTATPRPSIVPESTPLSVSTFTIRAKFVGVTQNVGSILAKASDSTGLTYNLNFTFDANGVYKAVIPVPAGTIVPSSVTISIKPEKHVARVFKDKAIVNRVLDVSASPFEPGDLLVQDGVVNANDISKVIAVIAKSTQTSSDLAVADVNYDGTVNAVDIGLILSTLSSKPDESL